MFWGTFVRSSGPVICTALWSAWQGLSFVSSVMKRLRRRDEAGCDLWFPCLSSSLKRELQFCFSASLPVCLRFVEIGSKCNYSETRPLADLLEIKQTIEIELSCHNYSLESRVTWPWYWSWYSGHFRSWRQQRISPDVNKLLFNKAQAPPTGKKSYYCPPKKYWAFLE